MNLAMRLKMMRIRLFFWWLSLIDPKRSARKAATIFQRVRKQEMRPREKPFFEKADHKIVDYAHGPIDLYEMGNPDGEIVLLVHGWDSNAGSLLKFAEALEGKGKRVIAFNLPGHGGAKKPYTNLVDCQRAFRKVLKYLNPDKPVSIIAHSFGAAVSVYGLSKMQYPINRLVFLTTPNYMKDIFYDFARTIGLGRRAFTCFLEMASKILQEPVSKSSLQHNLKELKFESLLLIHDANDKILGIENSRQIARSHEKAVLAEYQGIGHYRMLWNKEVVRKTIDFVLT